MSGSPIPIKTTFLTARSVWSSFLPNFVLMKLFAKRSWEMISFRVKSLLIPSLPVTQKTQLTGQPICEETHNVILLRGLSGHKVVRSSGHLFWLSTLWTFDFMDSFSCLLRWKRITASMVKLSWVLNQIFILSSLSNMVSGMMESISKFSSSCCLKSLERVVISSNLMFWLS